MIYLQLRDYDKAESTLYISIRQYSSISDFYFLPWVSQQLACVCFLVSKYHDSSKPIRYVGKKKASKKRDCLLVDRSQIFFSIILISSSDFLGNPVPLPHFQDKRESHEFLKRVVKKKIRQLDKAQQRLAGFRVINANNTDEKKDKLIHWIVGFKF